MNTKRPGAPSRQKLLGALAATLSGVCVLMVSLHVATSADESTTLPYVRETIPSQGRWQTVANEFAEIGANVKPYNVDQPNLMQVRLSPHKRLVPSDSKQLAIEAHAELGINSLVVIRDAGGGLIARSDSFSGETQTASESKRKMGLLSDTASAIDRRRRLSAGTRFARHS